ncbi:MAG: hypothetical protein Q3972_01380 [Corynebacterium sp.]|nr:hypothetical protein [Corynebacterium sp.]
MHAVEEGSPWRARLRRIFLGPGREDVDKALVKISDHMGTGHHATNHRYSTNITTHRAETIDLAMYYAPTMDGQAEPGEIVWIKVDDLHEERAILVIGRTKRALLGQLISPHGDHSKEENWVDIGSGAWDDKGRSCWLRLDKIIEISESGVRRQGTIMPQNCFDRVSARMRSEYGWG